MSYQPTTEELRDAFRRGRLWPLGWTFERAMSVAPVAQCLANVVRAERLQRENRSGRLPVQMSLEEA